MSQRWLTVLILLFLLPPGALRAENDDYYVERRSYGTGRESEPPRYVKDFNDWLELGFEHRSRYEHRNNDYRRKEQKVDNPLLFRTRLYVGIKEVLDPLRFTLEYSDARRNNSQFPPDIRDVNHNEPIQGYAELFFKETLDPQRPLSIRFGRMALEQLDRRLIARNEWRNTTNTFQGIRSIWGAKKDPWQLDVFSLRPLERLQEKLDEIEHSQYFHGVILDWRRWSRITTLQPYYLLLQQNGDDIPAEQATIDRLIHTVGVRGYGVFEASGLDYDFDLIRQTGHNGDEIQRAYAYVFEGGYTVPHAWKPRLSANIGVASGDRDPNDNTNQRFERLFGFARPWSNNDYFQMENIIAPKVRVELAPIADLKIDTGFSWYYLQSRTDRWQNGNLRDPEGGSGRHIGDEIDLRLRFPIYANVSANVGYAYFMAGEFAENASAPRDNSSQFFYTELTVVAFK